jgi:hypothetical protein
VYGRILSLSIHTGLVASPLATHTFTLFVDNFGIKFKGSDHVNHLKKILEHWYVITVDWKGKNHVDVSVN